MKEKKASYKNLTMGSKFLFGKHKGQSLRQVMAIDAQYIGWCIDNYVISLTPAAQREYEEKLHIRCRQCSCFD